MRIIAAMKGAVWLWLLLSFPCAAQGSCRAARLAADGARIHRLQLEIEAIPAAEMDTSVPPAVSGLLTQFKNLLSEASDAAMRCEGANADPRRVEQTLAGALDANPPQPPPGTVIAKDDHRFDEALGGYGHNLQVHVAQPAGSSGLLTVDYSVNVGCGDDHVLLVYGLESGGWLEKIRWQAAPLKEVSDAFGDFFDYGVLGGPGLRMVIAHGHPWCTSRLSGFSMDLVGPGPQTGLARVLWHADRGYSRFGLMPDLKVAGHTFELRLNADAMNLDPDGFERRVIYRYTVDGENRVRRIGPIATNAHGFVAEWLQAPWKESQNFTAPGSAEDLEKVYRAFERDEQPGETRFVSFSSGPVRACRPAGTFQVEIDAVRETVVPGKPGGDSTPLPSWYFHVREVRDGYVMVSAPTEADPRCTGGDLMPTGD